MNGVTRLPRQRVVDPDNPIEYTLPREMLPRRTIFFMGERPANLAEEKVWLSERIKEFREKLREFVKPVNLDVRRSREGASSGRLGDPDA